MSSFKNNEMVKKEMVLTSPGTSSNINITAPDSLDFSPKDSNSQSNASDTNSETDLGKASKSLITAPGSNPEGFSTLAGLFTLQSEEEHAEPVVETDWKKDGTCYGLDEESNEKQKEEPEKVKKWRRKLKYYSEQLLKRQRNTDEPNNDMSPESKLERHLNNVKKYCNEAVKEANLQGFVYGVVLQDDKVVSEYSENLAKWWIETIRFEHNGPAEVDKWLAENKKQIKLANNNEPLQKTCDSPMQLPDGTTDAGYMPPSI